MNIYKVTFIGIAITSAIALISAKLISADAESDIVTIETDVTEIGDFSAVSIKDATISDVGASYSGELWLDTEGNVTHPEWFEGDKLIKADDTYYLIKAKAAPDYTGYEFSNRIDIGDTESEQAARLEYIRASQPETKTINGSEYSYRTLSANGAMLLNLKCDPDEINYLTVRLWGGDTGDTILWVCDPVSGCMNKTNTSQPHRNSLTDRRDWVELNYVSDSPQYNGGFIYSTYEIPEIYTNGREYVSLRLYSTGGPSNYSTPSVKQQTESSRGIYDVFMTTEAAFEPTDFGLCGGSYSRASASAADMTAQKTALLSAVSNGIDTLRAWQIYGGDNYPSYMEGMITRSKAWKDKTAEDEDWKNVYYNSKYALKQNLTPLNMLELAARVYKNAEYLGVDLDTKAELLDRVVRGVDFLCRAQGSNGGFYGSEWIGGPERQPASGSNLTGFGLRSAGEALLLVWDDIDEDTKNELIDSDADGTADKNRIDAWNSMLASARDYLITLEGGYGHAPNQDMANSIAALRFDALLKKSGGSVLSAESVQSVLDINFGDAKNLVTSAYWVSPKGTVLENFGSVQGGYSGDYGSNAIPEMAQLAELADEYYGLDYTDYINRAYSVIDKYYFIGNKLVDEALVPCEYTEGLTSNRNAYYPGTERYPIDLYSAAQLQNDTALKIIYNYLNLKDIAYEVKSGELSTSSSHYEDNVLDALRLYLGFDEINSEIAARDTEHYDFMMEDESVTSYAWADEMARSVVIKDNGNRIYMTLNWRNPMHTGGYYNTSESSDNQRIMINNLARVHATNDSFDRYGYAEVYTDNYSETAWTEINQNGENSCIQALMILKYGDYTVCMNSRGIAGGTARDYSVEELEETAGLDRSVVYKELISGENLGYDNGAWVCGGNAASLSACSTMVLVPCADGTNTETVFASSDDTAWYLKECKGGGTAVTFSGNITSDKDNAATGDFAALTSVSTDSKNDIIQVRPIISGVTLEPGREYTVTAKYSYSITQMNSVSQTQNAVYMTARAMYINADGKETADVSQTVAGVKTTSSELSGTGTLTAKLTPSADGSYPEVQLYLRYCTGTVTFTDIKITAPEAEKEWTVYTCEYNDDGTLKNAELDTVTEPESVLVPAGKRVFIWDEAMKAFE